nr:VCBS repeat-containing protein [Deltaproteobacteria bacterium]
MPLLSRNTAVLSVFWLIIAFASTIGCDVSNNGSKSKDKNSVNQLTFIDSSSGLPRSSPWRNGLGFYDINDDGYLDIFAPPPRKAPEKYKKPVVWYGSEKGDWTESQLNIPSDMDYDYGAIAVSDFDGDKIPDIALAMHCLGLRFLKGVGQGRYINAAGFPPMSEFSPKEVVAD